MLQLNSFSDFYKKVFKYTFWLILFFLISGCTNKYYLDKRLDNFYFRKDDKYSIYSNPQLTYNNFIRVQLKDHLSPLPIVYSNCYSSYLIYFDYKKRYFWFPVFRLTIVKGSTNLNEEDEVVYDSLVYSYNTNELKSLLESLVIITNDLLYKKYTKNQFIKVTNKDLNDFSNYKSKNNNKELNNQKLPKREIIYRLYTNKEMYKH